MNKKYLILKKQVPKAQWGSPTSLVRKSKRDSMFQSLYGNEAFTNTPEAQIETEGLNLASDKSSKIAGGIGIGLGLAQVGADTLFNKASEKNSITSGYGDEVFDEKDAKLMTGQSTVKGGITGAQMGGSIVPGLGHAAGFAIGALTGLFTGKKKAKETKEASEELLASKIKGSGRTQDILNSQALTAKSGTKLNKKNLGGFKLPKKKSTSLVLRKGGKIETPGEVNVVVKGKLHKENNNLGNKDKGIPVVDVNGAKEYEVEKGEIIFRQDTTHMIEDYATKYKETEDDALLEELGVKIAKELLENTQDNNGEFGVKVKEDEN